MLVLSSAGCSSTGDLFFKSVELGPIKLPVLTDDRYVEPCWPEFQQRFARLSSGAAGEVCLLYRSRSPGFGYYADQLEKKGFRRGDPLEAEPDDGAALVIPFYRDEEVVAFVIDADGAKGLFDKSDNLLAFAEARLGFFYFSTMSNTPARLQPRGEAVQ
jgi:hypothetical protein